MAHRRHRRLWQRGERSRERDAARDRPLHWPDACDVEQLWIEWGLSGAKHVVSGREAHALPGRQGRRRGAVPGESSNRNKHSCKHQHTDKHEYADEHIDVHANADVHASIMAHVEQVNARFARVEQVKKIEILPQDLSQETGELTPTMKVKRNVVAEKYEEQIEALYE